MLGMLPSLTLAVCLTLATVSAAPVRRWRQSYDSPAHLEFDNYADYLDIAEERAVGRALNATLISSG